MRAQREHVEHSSPICVDGAKAVVTRAASSGVTGEMESHRQGRGRYAGRRMLRRVAPEYTRRGVMLRRLARREDDDPVQRVWSRFVARHPQATFIQIGAHNGLSSDFLMAPAITRRRGWSGILVEPIPELFDQLELRYVDRSRFRLVRAAITDHDGVVDLATVIGASDMPEWTDQLSSIHPEVLLAHLKQWPGMEDAMHMVTVPAMTFAQLASDIDHLDVLAIDTEGHDAVILDQVDLVRWQLAAVVFEHKHLSSVDRARCNARLERAGFTLTSGVEDTLALHRAR